MAALRARYPDLAARVAGLPGKENVRVMPTPDGSIAYGVQQQGRVIPITDAVQPVARMNAQLEEYAKYLQDFTRPILVVGLYPGHELLYLYSLSDKVVTPHCAQPIWVCLDSTVGLYAFLQSLPAVDVIRSPRVHWFWYEDLPARLEFLRAHPEFPHLFTLISNAPAATLDRIMPPFAQLIDERVAETERLRAANNQYYEALGDPDLAAVLAGRGGRAPRLLMPTCTWSTVVQHSARDTAAAFTAMGWDPRVLAMDAMLTPYFLVKILHDFRPDVFLFIDHLRSEAEECYPRNLMFVTWIQDEMDHLFSPAAGAQITEYARRGRRDLIIGYQTEQLVSRHGYPPDRVRPAGVPVNPALFHPVRLSADDRARFGCELAFMSNVSKPADQVLEHTIIPAVAPHGISRATAHAIHDFLWAEHRAGRTLCDRARFIDGLRQFPEFAAACPPGPQSDTGAPEAAEDLMRLFYWRLNDTIYRHVVLEWAVQLELDLALYGVGWEQHPRFARYARGRLAHGAELNRAYQAAGANLHLNIAQGMHQRLWEILASGGRVLLRAREPAASDPPAAAMRAVARQVLDLVPGTGGALPPADQARVHEWIFQIALAHARRAEPGQPLAPLVQQGIEHIIRSRPDWILPGYDDCVFNDKASLAARLRSAARG